MRLGYMLFNPNTECMEDDLNRLKVIGCDRVFMDEFENERKRPQWKKMLREACRNDEIVILCLSNAVKGLSQLALFFEICRIKRLRIISLKDKFDTKDTLFPSSISQLVDAIAAFPEDIGPLKISSGRLRVAKKKRMSSFQSSKEEREKRCVDLYNNGISVEDIKAETGFSSNSSIYRILKNKGVKVNRRVTKEVSDK